MLVTAVTVPEIHAASSVASPSNSAPTPGSVKKHHTERSPTVAPSPSEPKASRAALASPSASAPDASSSQGSSANAPNSSSRSTASVTEVARSARRVALRTRTGPTDVGEPGAPSCSLDTSRSATDKRTIRSASTSAHNSGGALDGAHSRSAVDSTTGSSPSTVQ